jgi:hypothetical protein
LYSVLELEPAELLQPPLDFCVELRVAPDCGSSGLDQCHLASLNLLGFSLLNSLFAGNFSGDPFDD